jgi:hypothetical protein
MKYTAYMPERGKKRKRDNGNIMEGVKLFKVHCIQ